MAPDVGDIAITKCNGPSPAVLPVVIEAVGGSADPVNYGWAEAKKKRHIETGCLTVDAVAVDFHGHRDGSNNSDVDYIKKPHQQVSFLRRLKVRIFGSSVVVPPSVYHQKVNSESKVNAEQKSDSHSTDSPTDIDSQTTLDTTWEKPGCIPYFERKNPPPTWIGFSWYFIGVWGTVASSLMLASAAYLQGRYAAMVMPLAMTVCFLAYQAVQVNWYFQWYTAAPTPGYRERVVESQMQMNELIAAGEAPMVDLFITCCREPVDVVQDTVEATLRQTYPHDRYKIFVLDDGGSDALKEWVEDRQARCYEESGLDRLVYVRRPKVPGVPHYYKAGNLNYALGITKAPFVAQLDADMIPTSEFLLRVLALCYWDKKAAFCHCPQTFYNTGVMDVLDDIQTYSHLVLYSKLDNAEVSPNGGSGVVFRREALESVNGFSTDSLGEDYLTSYRLVLKGWRSQYLREPMQVGLAPWTLDAWLIQRRRWRCSSLEILQCISKDIWTSTVLTLRQKLNIFCALTAYISSPLFLLVRVVFLFLWLIGIPSVGNCHTLGQCNLTYSGMAVFFISYQFIEYSYMWWYMDLPGAMNILARIKCWAEFETPFAAQWISARILHITSPQWKVTGSHSTKHSKFLYYVGRLWFHFLVFSLELGTACWAAYMAVNTLQDGSDPRLAIVCVLGAIAVATRIPVKLVPPYMYLYKFPKAEERRKLAMVDEDGVPQVKPEDQWIKHSNGITFWIWLEPLTNLTTSIIIIYVLLGGPLPGLA